MHDFDRTMQEFEYEFQDENEFENEYESEFEFENEYESNDEWESPFSESQEIDLASELLTVDNEEELEQFLGKLVRGAAKGVGKFMKSPAGKALGGILKSAAKKALPIAGGALGTFIGGPAGSALGSKLGALAGNALGLELEGLSPEDQEFEMARGFVRFAGQAAKNLNASSPRGFSSPAAARKAVFQAAKVYAPGLLRKGGSNGRKGRCNCQASKGTWYRKGNTIILRSY
jgi:hypothetical protein